MATLVDLKPKTASGSTTRKGGELTLRLAGGKYGEGDIHYRIVVHFNQEQLAALLADQFTYPIVTLEVSDDAVILMA